MEEELYTVVIDGKPTGPYRLDELNKLNIITGTFIKKPGMDDYKEAHELPELRELFGFKYQQTLPQYFASFDQRLVAYVIDYLVVLTAFLIIMFIIYLIVDQHAFRVYGLVGLILMPLGKLVYGSIAEATSKQATIGKRLMDIKVTNMLGNRLSLVNSFGRNFAKIISNVTLCFGYIYLFLNKKQQCLHDLIAEALVIKQRLL